jgi:hypothetical protein
MPETLPPSMSLYPVAYTPAKGSFEYYSASGKYLGAWGSGAFADFRGLLESEYQDVLTFQRRVQERVAETADPTEDPGWSKPLIGPIAQAMFEASKAIVVQANQDTLINKLFNDARAAHGEEHGAYLVYSLKLGTLSLIRATNRAPQSQRRTRFHWDIGTDASGRAVMPTDATQVVIGTIHTHWDDQAREAPELSRDVDLPSARTMKFVVYALDRRYLHRADPDGTPHNKMTRDISDVLSPALRVYGKSFTP